MFYLSLKLEIVQFFPIMESECFYSLISNDGLEAMFTKFEVFHLVLLYVDAYILETGMKNYMNCV
jgi:hypothetical protein